jgi:hypothetical protein
MFCGKFFKVSDVFKYLKGRDGSCDKNLQIGLYLK